MSKRKMIYTDGGFGVEKVSKAAIKRNFETLVTIGTENPMIAPLTDAEEFAQISETDLKELETCTACGCYLLRRYKKAKQCRTCWEEGYADYKNNGRDL